MVLMSGYGTITQLGTGGSGGGHTIKDEGSALTQRTNLNFVGDGVTATDDAGDNETTVTIPGNAEIDGGFANSVYLAAQVINGGTA